MLGLLARTDRSGGRDLIGALDEHLDCPVRRPGRRCLARHLGERQVLIMSDEPVGVYGGVDTHKDVHVAAAVDQAGRLLGTASFGAIRSRQHHRCDRRDAAVAVVQDRRSTRRAYQARRLCLVRVLRAMISQPDRQILLRAES